MSFDYLARIRDWATRYNEITRNLTERERYNCCICGHDVRTAGGSSSEASALCNRCVVRISAVDQCDFCGWGTSTMQIRIVDTSYNFVDVGENDNFPGLGEMYRTCHECFRKLSHPNHEFYDHILRRKCQFCSKRFGLISVRFMSGENMYDSRRCCTKCLPRVRETADRWNQGRSRQQPDPENEANIEIKDNLCYIWNPTEVEIIRDHHLGSRTLMKVKVIMGGHANRPDLSNAIGCRRAFIYDKDVIWILKECMLDCNASDRSGLDASFFTVSYDLRFVVTKFEIRNTETEMERNQTRRLDNSGRDTFHNHLYTDANSVIESIASFIATGSDWSANTGPEGVPGVRGIEGHSGERVELNDSGLNADRTFALPRTFTAVWNSPIETEPLGSEFETIRNTEFARAFTLDYSRALGNNVTTPLNDVLVWCSCGFRGETTHTNNDFRHSHMHINVENGLSGPGSNFAMNVGGHTLHFQQAHAQSGS